MIRPWLKGCRKYLAVTCVMLAAAGVSRAGDNESDLRKQLEEQGRQIEELKRMIQSGGVQPAAATDAPKIDDGAVKKIVADYLQEKDAKQKEERAKKAEEGYRVGSDLNIRGRFDENGYPWLYTPNNDFRMHIGSWVQYDNVFWDQSPGLRAAPGSRPGHKQGVASGATGGGIGDLEDGEYFRRIRPFLEGTFYENYEYRLNLALENNQFSTTGLDEFWMAVNNVPAIGTIRLGHVKNALGFEGDMTSSSRTMTFMERSAYSEAIELNQNFVTGIWLNNNFLDQRMTYTATAFRADNGASSGTFFGDGQWGAQGRLTFLPVYECEGREWLHVGLSGGWRNGTNNRATSTDRVFQLRARPELRDDDPAASPSGAQVIPNADSNRLIDTGAIAAENEYLMGLELVYVRGPFSVQAEYGWNWISNAVGIAPAGFKFNPAIVPAHDYVFNGGYVQLAYTLTGENRAYDRAHGTLTREYFKGGPFTNAWLVRDENGNLNWGIGAWEIAARYSYVDLNDGSGLNRIQGGLYDGVSLGLNWYLNSNLTCMFDWVYDRRFDVPTGTTPGWTSGYGMRVQLSF